MMKETKNILITGSNGQLGKCLKDVMQNTVSGMRYEVCNESKTQNFIFTDIEELDITDINAVADFVHKNKIECIINTAAYTAVDKAESEPLVAFEINEQGVWNLAHICMEQNVFLIHISTDYVFDGSATKPYKTNARTNPVSVYGASKLAGEKAIFFEQIPSVIIRTSWLYSQHGHNFMKTMLRLGKEKEEVYVVDDQYGAPTNAHDLAAAILQIIDQKDKITKPEIFHYANEGVTTWCGFAKEIMRIAKLPCLVHPITTAEYPTPAARPAYSVFDLFKIKNQFDIQIPNWVESLQRELS
ncbi:MAG: dTDP-4-dehydrorhamnose reductase [Bacteroidetes bacterium]|nr:dTDP-4-dehydrorhamnose reductase [Bacteroidota bacterium]MCL2301781.1 dTDP-4-dehydrorhamnose reductase [Lentimicrobiaceae bacterium]